MSKPSRERNILGEMVGVVQNEAVGQISSQIAQMVGTLLLTYSTTTGMNSILVIQHYDPRGFFLIVLRNSKK